MLSNCKISKISATALLAGAALTACGPQDNGQYPGFRMTDIQRTGEIIVSECLQVIQTSDAQRIAVMEEIGFTKRAFGYAKDVGGIFRLLTETKSDVFCGPSYARVSPSEDALKAGVRIALLKRGYRSTGKIVDFGSKNPLLSVGPKKAEVYTDGKNRVGLATSSGSVYSLPTLWLSRE